jgi:hypothetical protein
MDSIALSVLQNFFGDYVEGIASSTQWFEFWNLGIDSKNLVADLSGIEVKNLKLKKSALEGLELPVEVKEGIKFASKVSHLLLGILQRVSLKLPPLTELTKKPAKVLVERLYILVSPIYRTTVCMNSPNPILILTVRTLRKLWWRVSNCRK